MTVLPASSFRRRGVIRPRGHVALLLGSIAAVCVSACGLGEAKSPDGRIRRDTRIVHEECDTDQGGARNYDVDGDGRHDLGIVYRGGGEVCRAVDLNFDGRIDTWIFRAPDGSVRRRESDFDRDGRIDEIATYGGGTLMSKQVATNLAGRLDTWQYFRAGVLQRAERDSDGDSVIDQWWEYPRMPKSDCALVHSDVDGDGRPDPGATVDMCKEAGEAETAKADTELASPASSESPP